GGEHVHETAHALDGSVRAGAVDNGTFSNDVVHDDQAPRTGQFQRPGEVSGDVWLVSVDEDKIEWASTLGGELGQGLQGIPESEFDDGAQPGPLEVGPCDFSV